MSTPQIVFTLALVAVLLSSAVFFFRRQRQLAREANQQNLPDEERRYLRGRSRRLQVSWVLLGLLALWIGGSMLLEGRAQELANHSDAVRAEGREFILDPEDKPFVRLYGGYWIGGLLALLLLVGIAGIDLLAVRRHARQQFKKLKDDQRDMIARQAARFRRDRNGHGDS